MRLCNRCGIEKDESEFYQLSNNRGLMYECKVCFLSRPRDKDRERRNLQAWRKKNPDKVKEQTARWRANNPEKKRMQNLQRHEIRRSLTEDDLSYIEVITRDPCAYCGAPMEHVDHIDPVALGGDSDWTNFAPACGVCNRSKSDKSLLLWLAVLPDSLHARSDR